MAIKEGLPYHESLLKEIWEYISIKEEDHYSHLAKYATLIALSTLCRLATSTSIPKEHEQEVQDDILRMIDSLSEKNLHREVLIATLQEMFPDLDISCISQSAADILGEGVVGEGTALCRVEPNLPVEPET